MRSGPRISSYHAFIFLFGAYAPPLLLLLLLLPTIKKKGAKETPPYSFARYSVRPFVERAFNLEMRARINSSSLFACAAELGTVIGRDPFFSCTHCSNKNKERNNAHCRVRVQRIYGAKSIHTAGSGCNYVICGVREIVGYADYDIAG